MDWLESGQYHKGQKIETWRITDSTGKVIDLQKWKKGVRQIKGKSVANSYSLSKRGEYLSARKYYTKNVLTCQITYDSYGNIEDSTTYCYSQTKDGKQSRTNVWLRFPGQGGVAVHREYDGNCEGTLVAETCFTPEGNNIECAEFAKQVQGRIYPYDQVAIQNFLTSDQTPGSKQAMKRINFPPDLKQAGVADKLFVRIKIGEGGNIEKYDIDGNASELFIHEIIQILEEVKFTSPTWNGVRFPLIVWMPFDFKFK